MSSQVLDMGFLFYNLEKLESIDVSNFNTSRATSMVCFFYGCKKLKSINVSNFDTSHVTQMNYFLWHMENLESIDLSSFNTTNTALINSFFEGCKKLKSINLSNFDTSQVTDLSYFFYNLENLESIDLSNFNTTNVKNIRNFFYGCKKLKSINLSNFDTSHVTDMRYLFYGMENLESIDLSNFNIQNIKSLTNFFYNCKKLVSIDISFFNTSKITDFSYLFFGCESLESLNLLNMDTSSAKNMQRLFAGCKNLKSIDLTNFETPLVTSMVYMFDNCYSLKSIKFSSFFNTSKLNSLDSMFGNCTSLISLNLSSFVVTKVTNMNNMFYNCHNLKYLDIPHFSPKASKLSQIKNVFYNMSSLIFLNIDSLEINDKTKTDSSFDELPSDLKICSNKNKMKNYLISINKNFDCSDICFTKDIKIDINTNECIHSCKDHGYNHECNNICYNKCPENTRYKIKDLNNKDNIFAEYEDGVAVCLEPNTEGYFLDEYEFYEECFESCNFCYGKGDDRNNNCKKCRYNFFFIKDVDDIKFKTNCYERCQYYYYLDESREYMCTENQNCTKNFDYLVPQKSKCIDYCTNDNIYKYEYDKICYEKCPENTIISSKKEYLCLGEKDIYQIDLVTNDEIHQLIKGSILDKYNISNEEDIVYPGGDNFFFQMTNTKKELEILEGKNTNNNNTNKFSVIDLEQCESLLKSHYQINDSIPLILLKYERISNISSERSIQYEVYEPYNKTKLNLSVCEIGRININIYIPVVLSVQTQNLYNQLKEMGYDLFDINSPFYNDICIPYESEGGTDVLLKDRIDSYFYNEDTSCQSNCKFSNYSFESQYLKCECNMKNSEINANNAKAFNPKSLYQSFYDVLKFSNYKILKCTNLALSIKSFTLANKGSILSLVYFFIHFIFLIAYFIKGINQLKIEFSKLIKKNIDKSEMKNINEILDIKTIKNNKKSHKAKEKDDKSKNRNYKYHNKNKNNESDKLKLKNIKEKNKAILKAIFFPPKKHISIFQIPRQDLKFKSNIIKSKNARIDKIKKNSSTNSVSKHILTNEHLNQKSLEIKKNDKPKKIKLDYYELNNLEYNIAKKSDKRNFSKVYWSLLKREHIFFFTFITRDDHNITFVKYSRFFFLLCTDMAMNVFFFSDETMHKMFLDYGKYNFIQQIPQIIYSTAVSKIIETFLCFLSMTDKYYYEIKDNNRLSKTYLLKIIKCIKIKIAFFFLFTSLMFVFYWYVITCFCAIYQNTQEAFIKDSLSSFALEILSPFGIYLIPSLFRIIALKGKKINLVCLYKLSNIIPLF